MKHFFWLDEVMRSAKDSRPNSQGIEPILFILHLTEIYRRFKAIVSTLAAEPIWVGRRGRAQVNNGFFEDYANWHGT